MVWAEGRFTLPQGLETAGGWVSREETASRLPRPVRLLPAAAAALAVLILLGTVLVGGVRLASENRSASNAPNPAAPAGQSAGGGELAPIFTPEVRRWEADILAWSAQFGLDPNLVATVMQIESCGDPEAVSRAGAQGLFQVMPYHFAAGEAMLDPNTNAERGLGYLAGALATAGGDAGLALAGYNGGHSVIGLSPRLWSAETQRYFYWGTGIYADAVLGAETSPRLEEWLNAGGRSLCTQAARR